MSTRVCSLAKRPEEVASVVAHEIIHAEQRHGMRRMLGALGTQAETALIFGGTDLASSRPRDAPVDAQTQPRAGGGSGPQGVLMVDAGIDPDGMARMPEVLGAQGPQAKGLAAWFSTHPDTQARAATARRRTTVPTVELPAPQR